MTKRNRGLSLAGRVWAMEPQALAEMVERSKVFDLQSASEVSASDSKLYATADGVATIAVNGPLFAEDSFWCVWVGGTSYPAITAAIEQANEDPAVTAIELSIDTPGGDAAGMDQCAASIRASAKTVTARVTGMCCSAGYGLASAASSIEAAPTSLVGCVGTMLSMWVNDDVVTFRSSETPLKNPEPKSEDGAEHYQQIVDDMNAFFMEAISVGRGIPVKEVPERCGRGATMIAHRALALGMIDAITESNQATAPNQSSESTPSAKAGETGRPEAGRNEHTGGRMTLKEALAKVEALQAKLDGSVDAAAFDAMKVEAEAQAAAAKAASAKVEQLTANLTAMTEADRTKRVEALVMTGRIGPDDVSQEMAANAYDREQSDPDCKWFTALEARAEGSVTPLKRSTHSGENEAGDGTKAAAIADLYAQAKENKTDFKTELEALRKNDPAAYAKHFGGAK